MIGVVAYLSGVATTPAAFYAICAWLGFATGFWAVMVTMAVEQFGTDLRATAATSVPTFVRASAVPMTLAFFALRQNLGIVGAAALVGIVAFGLATFALWRQPETYGRDLDYVEDGALFAAQHFRRVDRAGAPRRHPRGDAGDRDQHAPR